MFHSSTAAVTKLTATESVALLLENLRSRIAEEQGAGQSVAGFAFVQLRLGVLCDPDSEKPPYGRFDLDMNTRLDLP